MRYDIDSVVEALDFSAGVQRRVAGNLTTAANDVSRGMAVHSFVLQDVGSAVCAQCLVHSVRCGVGHTIWTHVCGLEAAAVALYSPPPHSCLAVGVVRLQCGCVRAWCAWAPQ